MSDCKRVAKPCWETRRLTGSEAFAELRSELAKRAPLIARIAMASGVKIVDVSPSAFDVVVSWDGGHHERRYTPADSGFVSYCQITRKLAGEALSARMG